MSLIKKAVMTEKKIAASRSNGSQSLGPATKGGKEHCASVNVRHGFYAQAPVATLRPLG